MSKSYDLSTSTKWTNLADGDHVVKLRARGSGFGDSSFSNSVTVTKGAAMPAKGDLITIETKQYRVLKVNGSVAEVLAMYDASSYVKFDSSSPSYSNAYAGKNIDTYCNDTFYSGLSESMKNAIVDKTFAQDCWDYYLVDLPTTPPYYSGKNNLPNNYYLSINNLNYGPSITRHCYCISVQDVLDYLGCTTSMSISDTTLMPVNVWKMFWNITQSPDRKAIWLRSARSENYGFYSFTADGYDGSVNVLPAFNERIARPAFQIDLSKIEWSPVGG